MSSRKGSRCVALFVGLVVAQVLGLVQTPDAAPAAAPDPRLAHPVLLGVGATWSKRDEYQNRVHSGAMLGFGVALGRYAAIGLLGDLTNIDDLDGHRHRLLTGLDLKLFPFPGGIVRPWVTVGVAASFLDDTGAGFGVGAGAYFLPNIPTAFFVDVRRYHIGNWEGSEVEQVMLRAGVAF